MPSKSYIPLESNPEVFTQLITRLGVRGLEFQDVFSLDDPDLLALVPRPALALVLVFPTSDAYERQTALDEAARTDYTGSGPAEPVVWFKQTIHNACGLYGILHAVANGHARHFIRESPEPSPHSRPCSPPAEPESALATLLATCIPLPPPARALALERSAELEAAHADAAQQGDSAVPARAEDAVDFHYVCFVRSHADGHLYEMDGGKRGPVDRGAVLGADGDVLGRGGLDLVRAFIQREKGANLNFSLMALVAAA